MSSTSIFKLELCQNGWNGCLKVRGAGTAYLQYITALKGCLYCTRSLQRHIISQEQLSIRGESDFSWSVFEQYTLTFTAEGVHLSTDTIYEATGRINYFHSKLHGTEELQDCPCIKPYTQISRYLHCSMISMSKLWMFIGATWGGSLLKLITVVCLAGVDVQVAAQSTSWASVIS